MSDVSASAETRAVLRDLLRELGAPTALRKARRWAEQHAPAHATLWALLDEAERPQRLAFEALVMEAIELNLYPSADALDIVRHLRTMRRLKPDWPEERRWRHVCEGRASGLVLDGDQARWRRALLERLGWRKGRGDRWIPPARTA